jgi:nucleoside-diphosphate-sugar epimerase
MARRGYAIRALARDPAAAARKLPAGLAIDWRRGDALDRAAVTAAAQGASWIFHGVNPPGYARWREDGLPMLQNSVAAARSARARLLFPGNVYLYGPDAGALLDETAPRHPLTRKGRVRLEMETILEQEAAHGARALVLRAGDFFGPGVEGSWFTQAVAKGGTAATKIYDLSGGVGHSWAYVPDLAEAFADLAERDADLPAFTSFNFAGHWVDPGRSISEVAATALGRPASAIKRFPWVILYLGAPFSTFMREAIEMRWLWSHPLQLDGRRLEAFLGRVPHTPLDTAVRHALGLPA